MINNEIAYGLVLDGGGTRGAFQIGAWRALREYGIKIEAVTGTSIGSINGAFLAAGDYEKAVSLWETMDYSRIFATDPSDIGKIIKDKGLDVSPLKELIDREVDEEAVRHSSMDYGLATFNLSTRKEMDVFIGDIPEGMLGDYIMASSYLPFFKTQKLVGGMTFLDGGLYNNSPVNMLLKKGCRQIIVIKLGERIGIEKKVDRSQARIYEVLPSEDLGSLIDIDRTKIRYNMRLGYYDTMRLLQGLAGRRYYIKANHRERYYLLQLSKVKPAARAKLEKAMRRNPTGSYRAFFEEGAGYLAKRLKLGRDWDLSGLAIGMMEHMAESMGMERLAIYEETELLRQLKESMPAFFEEEGLDADSLELDRIIGEMLLSF